MENLSQVLFRELHWPQMTLNLEHSKQELTAGLHQCLYRHIWCTVSPPQGTEGHTPDPLYCLLQALNKQTTPGIHHIRFISLFSLISLYKSLFPLLGGGVGGLYSQPWCSFPLLVGSTSSILGNLPNPHPGKACFLTLNCSSSWTRRSNQAPPPSGHFFSSGYLTISWLKKTSLSLTLGVAVPVEPRLML